MEDSPMKSEEFIKGVLKLVRKLNQFNLPGSKKPECIDFYIEDKKVGILLPKNITILQKYYQNIFDVQQDRVVLNSSLKTFDERTSAFEKALIDMRDKDHFKLLKGWRNEHYYVRTKFSEEPLLKIERSGVSIFGFKSYGCHINGYIKKDDQYFMWIPRRSKTKPTYPGMLDNFAAGGLTAGLGLRECAIKELEEEAGVSYEISKNIKSVDSISYAYEKPEGISIEGQFVFDLKLPLDYVPKNTDGEVDSFNLMNIDQVKRALISDEFKPNSASITLNFLLRKGLLTPDEASCYFEIIENLHQPGL